MLVISRSVFSVEPKELIGCKSVTHVSNRISFIQIVGSFVQIVSQMDSTLITIMKKKNTKTVLSSASLWKSLHLSKKMVKK